MTVGIWAFAGLLIVFSAFAFWVMLSAMPVQQPTVTPVTLERLRALKPRLNFDADEATYYTGIRDPAERSRANTDFADLIDRLVVELPKYPSRKFLEQQLSSVYSSFRLSDTEDRERAIGYCQEILHAVDIRDGARFLNILLYGPILGRMVKVRDSK